MPRIQSSDPSQVLFDALESFVYPDGLVAVPKAKRISGLAFFPGGRGLYVEGDSKSQQTFPIGKIMVVGQDFDTVAGFDWSSARGSEGQTSATWRNLLALLKSADVLPTDCFFTNAYMGLRTGKTNTGPSPGSESKEFRKACADFFQLQLKEVRPTIVLCLGTAVTTFMASFAEFPKSWSIASLKGIDDSEQAVVINVRFASGKLVVPVVVALVHPSYRHVNIKNRRYADLTGAQAEETMLRDAIRIADSLRLNEQK